MNNLIIKSIIQPTITNKVIVGNLLRGGVVIPITTPLNRFRNYSTNSTSTSSTNNNNNGQPKNLGYLNNLKSEYEILKKEIEPPLVFDPVEEFESHDTFENPDGSERVRISTDEATAEEIKIDTGKIETNEKQAPYYHASKAAEKSLRTHLNRFFLKVHPDIFFNNELHRSINQKSLAKLNNLLRTLEDYVSVSEDSTSTTKLDKIPTQISFNFVVEFEEEGRIGEINQDFHFIDAPESILTSKSSLLQYTTELRFSVYRQIFLLLEKAEISIPKSDKELLKNPEPVAKDLYDDPWEEYFSEDPTNMTLSGQLDAYIQQFPVTEERLHAEFTPEHQKLMDTFQESRVFFYFGENAKGDLDYMRHLNLREEAEYQIVHLKHNLMALEYQDWSSLPIMIVDRKYYNLMEPTLSAKGFVVLEKDFDPTTTLTYIKEIVLPKTTKTFKSIFTTATNNRSILEEKTIHLENLLGSGSVVVENLFSVNQKALDEVREKFNQSLTMIGELKIPAIQLLDTVKAESWKKLPNTNFNDAEFQQWKINNVTTGPQEKLEFIASREKQFVDRGRIQQPESQITQLERIQSTMEKINNIKPTESDERSSPLVLVDRNQFDSIQSTPFLNSSLSAVERLTHLFEHPTQVPFFISNKPVDHPLAPLKQKSSKLDSDDFENGVLIQDEYDEEFDEEDQSDDPVMVANNLIDNEDNFDELNEESNDELSNEFDEDIDDNNFSNQFDFDVDENGNLIDLRDKNTNKTTDNKSLDIVTVSREEMEELKSHFSLSNVIPISAETIINPLYVSKINFMTTGNNFENTSPILINGPANSNSVNLSSDNSVEINDNAGENNNNGQLDINSILSDAKQSSPNGNGISSDLDDFFSKLSNLDSTKQQPEPINVASPSSLDNENSSLFDQLQKLQSANYQESQVEQQQQYTESLSSIEQKLSDFKWDKINLIISDHYQFIITHDNKEGFCFIPSNFNEKELFIFLNSVQDSFDLINGGSDKAMEEYTLKSLLAVENSVNQLQHLYKFKSLQIDNDVVPSKLTQYSFITSFTQSMQDEGVTPVENVTLKNIAKYVTLVVSDENSIDYLDENGRLIDSESDLEGVFNSQHALIKVDSTIDNFQINLFLQYCFVTLGETSEFFKNIITKTYQLPSLPPTPPMDKVVEVINQQFGFDRIKNKSQIELEIQNQFDGIDEQDFDEINNIQYNNNINNNKYNNNINIDETKEDEGSETPKIFSASSFLDDIKKVNEDIDSKNKK